MPGTVNTLLKSELKQELSDSPYLFFGRIVGLKVADFEELRRSLEPSSRRCLVVKNRLVKHTLTELDKASANSLVGGMTCVMTAKDEPQVLARAIVRFAKTREENFNIAGALLDGQVVNSDYVKQLALLPTKQDMRAQVTFAVKAPITNFVLNLRGVLQSLVLVLNAAREKVAGGETA